MRKSKYLIAGVAAVALSVAVSSAAQAATFQGQSLVVTPSSPPQDKKTPGPINSLFTDVITGYTNTPPSPPDKYATNTKLYFPTDFVFNTAGLSQCDPTPAFAGGTTANAIATCGAAQVSSAGSAALEGPVAGVTAVVTAFNGTQPAGLPTILLHSQSSAGPSLTLTGTLKPSDLGGFGKMLDVPVDLGPFQGTEAITDFRVTVKKVKLPKGGKSAAAAAKKKKKKKAPKYYIMAKCKKKTWNFQAVTTYNTGAPTTATSSAKCKQKAKKKKKK